MQHLILINIKSSLSLLCYHTFFKAALITYTPYFNYFNFVFSVKDLSYAR